MHFRRLSRPIILMDINFECLYRYYLAAFPLNVRYRLINVRHRVLSRFSAILVGLEENKCHAY